MEFVKRIPTNATDLNTVFLIMAIPDFTIHPLAPHKITTTGNFAKRLGAEFSNVSEQAGHISRRGGKTNINGRLGSFRTGDGDNLALQYTARCLKASGYEFLKQGPKQFLYYRAGEYSL